MKTLKIPFALLAAVFFSTVSHAEVFDAAEFGAKADGSTKDTAALQKAIDAASAAGGGRVMLRKGTYLSGTLFLKNGVELHLAEGAVIKGSPDKEDYCAADAFAQNYALSRKSDNTSGGHLIVAHDCTDIAITGRGRIDGNSAAFLTDAKGRQHPDWKRGIPWRPGQMLYIVDCSKVRIEGIEMYNSPYWTCHLLNNDDVIVSGCRIRTERKKYRTWNGDGIDIDRCTRVTVRNCDINTEDDCITLRASCASRLKNPKNCRNVLVENCILSSACTGVRIGVGEGVIRDCRISGMVIRDTNVGVSFISAWGTAGRGCDIHGITLESIAADCRKFLDLRYGRKPGCAKDAVIRDILFKNIKAETREPNEIVEEPGRGFRNIEFTDCTFTTRK